MPEYPAAVPARLRYRLCRHCGRALVNFADAEGVVRTRCPACGWIHYPANVVGIGAVIVTPAGVVSLHPPGGGAALPGGVVEIGERPEDAVVRACRQETGLEVEVVRELGRWFWPDHPHGPMLSFGFEVRPVGGTLRDGLEGRAEVRPCGAFPAIAPARKGSAIRTPP